MRKRNKQVAFEVSELLKEYGNWNSVRITVHGLAPKPSRCLSFLQVNKAKNL